LAAAVTVGGLVAGSGLGIASAHESSKQTPERAAEGNGADAIVVRVRDLNAGALEIFTGEQRIEVQDKELAKRLARAASKR
jgi:hypothetical protein